MIHSFVNVDSSAEWQRQYKSQCTFSYINASWHMNTSYLVWMSHVTYKRVTLHMNHSFVNADPSAEWERQYKLQCIFSYINASWHGRHISNKRVMSLINESRCIWITHLSMQIHRQSGSDSTSRNVASVGCSGWLICHVTHSYMIQLFYTRNMSMQCCTSRNVASVGSSGWLICDVTHSYMIQLFSRERYDYAVLVRLQRVVSSMFRMT